LNRTHPVVEALGSYVLNTALDPLVDGKARRCGVIRTTKVSKRTTVLLVRFRYHIITARGGTQRALLAEDCQTLAFAGAPQEAAWLDTEAVEKLLTAEPEANVLPDQAREFLQRVIDGFEFLTEHLNQVARQRGGELLDAHRRVRTASRLAGVSYSVVPHLPPDVLGIYIYLPKV